MDEISRLYERKCGVAPESVTRLKGAGSNRQYFRVTGEKQSLIATIGEDVDENEAFIYLSRHFAEKGLFVPEVMAVSNDRRCYLQTDLGDVSLFSMFKEGHDKCMPMLEQTMRVLADLQYKGVEGLDFTRCFPVEAMDFRSVMWDLNYFKYSFLKCVGVAFSEPRLEDEFEALANKIARLTDESGVFMVRDFQSRNVMVHDGKPWVIDFQGGRRGPAEYDVASFLWQARAKFTDDERAHLINVYKKQASKYGLDIDLFDKRLELMVLFRTLQVLGAYGYRGYFEQKAHFLASIDAAVENLRLILKSTDLCPPYLRDVLSMICELPQFAKKEVNDGLCVRVMSFSYMKGVPRDESGNGGGFVFDCRAVHNPGRYEEYKKLTGRDAAVKEFLERDGEIAVFLEHAEALVDASVERYLKRGFKNLMVCFGCTGGQHRSVYSAEAMARHLNEKYGVEVMLEHREQGIVERFKGL